MQSCQMPILYYNIMNYEGVTGVNFIIRIMSEF